ncbi:MAG: hypothetical protein PVG65_02030 [Candidatus Thorarchaeota archaeon]
MPKAHTAFKREKNELDRKKIEKKEEAVTPWINTLRDEVLLYCYGGII